MNKDLQKARDIAAKHGPFVNGDRLVENIVAAIAEGIALGRNEALEAGAPELEGVAQLAAAHE